MTEDGQSRRRHALMLAAFGAVIVIFVLVTLRCTSTSDDDARRADAKAAAARRGGAVAGGTVDASNASAASGPDDAGGGTRAASGGAGSGASAAGTGPGRSQFVLLGDAEAEGQRGRGFGDSVAVDRDIVVIAAPRFRVGAIACGAAYVFERRGGVWKETARLDSPRPEASGFARRVGVSGERVVVFGGRGQPAGSDAEVFRSYVRSKDGAWAVEAEAAIGSFGWDAALSGDTAAVNVCNSVEVWRIADGTWRREQVIEPSGDQDSSGFGSWISLSGDSLAVNCDTPPVVAVYRRSAKGFVHEAAIPADGDATFGTLVRGGRSLVTFHEIGRLSVHEPSPGAWTRVLQRSGFGEVVTLPKGHAVAGDGDLAVASSRDWNEFVVVQRRDDGWYRTSLAPPKNLGAPADSGGRFWPAWHPNVALSGRTAVVGTDWDASDTGRAWIFDVTDQDLARATKIEPDAR
jgi:hypothetical protein